MDARLDPAKYAGLAEGDAHVIRNADARASDDAIRSLVIDWLTIADLDQSVVDDVARIRAHPLVPGRIPIYGYIYDVTTGRLNEILEATKAGEPRPG
jgi:carbonic anhydrase